MPTAVNNERKKVNIHRIGARDRYEMSAIALMDKLYPGYEFLVNPSVDGTLDFFGACGFKGVETLLGATNTSRLLNSSRLLMLSETRNVCNSCANRSESVV